MVAIQRRHKITSSLPVKLDRTSTCTDRICTISPCKSFRPPEGPPSVEYFPDEEYRFLQVENNRFKVHASILSQNSSVFRKLFSSSRNNGTTLEEAVKLSGHTVDQFKSLLFVLHSHPVPSFSQMSLVDLVDIAELSHRYCFKLLQIWSLGALYLMSNDPTSSLSNASSDILKRILALAVRCNRNDLSLAVQTRWAIRIHLHQLPPAPAIATAENWSLPFLQSHGYYEQLMLIHPYITNPTRFFDPCSDLGLSDVQFIHVMSGFHSLLAYWNRLRVDPPTFERSERCTEHPRCLAVWKHRWGEAAERPIDRPAADVLRKLKTMEKSLSTDQVLGDYMWPACRLKAFEALRKKSGDLSRHLHHHFDL